MGSTIIVLFGKDRAKWNETLTAGKQVRLGEMIGECVRINFSGKKRPCGAFFARLCPSGAAKERFVGSKKQPLRTGVVEDTKRILLGS